MNSSKDKFDPELLKNLDFNGNEDLIRELDWFVSELKDELKLALRQLNKSRAKELAAKIDEVQSKIKQLMTEPPTPTAPQMEIKVPKRELPVAVKNTQFDLFRQFTSNHDNDVSNTLEVWDTIPKYFLTPAQVKALRTEEGLAAPVSWDYVTRDGDARVKCTVRIQPALLEDRDNHTLAYFPGSTEEIIEEILKKFLLDQQLGLHNPDRVETWVRFSLSMIERELAARGKARNRNEIKHSLEVMSGSHIVWTRGGKSCYQGSIISELVSVDRSDYKSDGNALWAARLPSLVSASINNFKYRQFNYIRLMDLGDALSRWLYKRLINRYKQASKTDLYTIHFAEIKQSSALLQQKDDRGNRKKVLSALIELKESGALEDYQCEEIKTGKAVIDVKYTLSPSDDFIKEQKAANKRASDSALRAQQEGLLR